MKMHGEVNLKNLEEFLNKKGLAIILGGDDVSLKFVGTIHVYSNIHVSFFII